MQVILIKDAEKFFLQTTIAIELRKIYVPQFDMYSKETYGQFLVSGVPYIA